MRMWWIAAALCVALPAAANDPAAASMGDLVAHLGSLRDNCAAMAKDAAGKYSMASFQAGLDHQTAVEKAKMDAQVYGVGHGNRETTQFLIDQLHDADIGYSTALKTASDNFASAKNDVSACVSSAQASGKQDYASFKAQKKNKGRISEAESLMTAWLANIGEISADKPQGSDATSAQWKTAKAHAELDAL